MLFVYYFQKYKFAEENAMADHPDALEEGKKRVAAGDIPSAVLCFEAAAKTSPDNAMVWQLLGTTQAENEQVIFLQQERNIAKSNFIIRIQLNFEKMLLK